ncbi:MAG TPA: 30S ribosomal protein S16, partial [Candidatus Saccharimonadales bacterium]|nr:30S ribosomal protein S16 [Candidatus Saccharimonadales bacterium]
MLAIRLQRVGRKGYATYRLAVQEAQRHPTSGRVVAYVGTYNPHTKEAKVQVEEAQKYLDNGAQPTPRVVKLLKDAGVKLPNWVKKADAKSKTIRNADKLRKNQPKDETPEV